MFASALANRKMRLLHGSCGVAFEHAQNECEQTCGVTDCPRFPTSYPYKYKIVDTANPAV
jgi:hypothetical protein